MAKDTNNRNIAPRNECRPGSIEQQLDMCETGYLKGDELERRNKLPQRPEDRIDELNYQMDMSDEAREGDEESGDDHSSGLQGGEAELQGQPDLEEGMPGAQEETNDEIFDEVNKRSA